MIKPVTSPVIQVRIEANAYRTQVIWHAWAADGTEAKGFAKSAGDAMRDAAAFVDAMAQPRRGGIGSAPKLRVVTGEKEAPDGR